MLHQNDLIEDYRRTEPLKGVLYGVLADHPVHGRLVRWSIPGISGRPCHGYKRLDPNEPDRPAVDLLAPQGECQALLTEIGRANPHDRLVRLTETVAEAEFRKFQEQWPNVSVALEIYKAPTVGIFPTGAVWHPVVFDARVGAVNWRAYVDLSISGDFGLSGKYDPEIPLDEAAMFADDLDTRAARNSRSIITGKGMVIGAYPIDRIPEVKRAPGTGPSCVSYDGEEIPLAVVVRSALCGDRTVTLVRISPQSQLPS